MTRIAFRSLFTLLAAALALGAAAPAFAGKTLDTIKQRGAIQCGVSTGVAGFSAPDSQGQWSGLDADTCRAPASAVLGDAKKPNFVPPKHAQRCAALPSG